MSGITLRQLEIFAQVVEHGSFRRCAEHIGVSQVSISEHVRELESRLGAPLFARHSGSASTLTAAGERAHRRVVAILADLNDLMWDIGGGRPGITRNLAIAIHPFVMRQVGATLTEFRRQRPDVAIKLDLTPASAEDLAARVNQRELDLAYFFAFDGQPIPDSTLIRVEPLAVFVGPTHPLTRKPVASMADLRSTPAVRLGTGNVLRALVDRALEQAGAGGSPIALETDEYGLILSSVHRNLGYVCMFQSAAQEAPADGLVQIALERPLPALQMRELMRHSASQDPVLSSLRETLGKPLTQN